MYYGCVYRHSREKSLDKTNIGAAGAGCKSAIFIGREALGKPLLGSDAQDWHLQGSADSFQIDKAGIDENRIGATQHGAAVLFKLEDLFKDVEQ